jgi:uncharacterized OB-fold protein
MIADDVSAPFWDATRDQQLTLQWCDACDQPIHYPRPRCPRCLGTTLSWRAARGTGTVYAVSVMHQAGNPMMESRVPYAVALIDLDEGARMLSNVVGIDPDEVAVGARVHVTWEPMADGRHLPQFTVVGAA